MGCTLYYNILWQGAGLVFGFGADGWKIGKGFLCSGGASCRMILPGPGLLFGSLVFVLHAFRRPALLVLVLVLHLLFMAAVASGAGGALADRLTDGCI